ncbi:MAG TPA: hypothetical protein EYP90_10165 [Chromatiaceae bacterium]|nr:hypothetical protein [Chromatiaceae bacterium]
MSEMQTMIVGAATGCGWPPPNPLHYRERETAAQRRHGDLDRERCLTDFKWKKRNCTSPPNKSTA